MHNGVSKCIRQSISYTCIRQRISDERLVIDHISFINTERCIYRVFHELRSLLRESVPYVKLYRYNPKHLYPKLNGYGDNGKRSLKVWQLLHTY